VLAWLDAAYGVSILRDSVRSIFRYNYRSLSDWRLYKIEQHVQNCTHDRGLTPSAFESHVLVLSDSCCPRTLKTVPSWIRQILDKGGRSNESVGKIPEVCRRMRGHGQICAVPGEQSYVGPFGGEMGSVCELTEHHWQAVRIAKADSESPQVVSPRRRKGRLSQGGRTEQVASGFG
jgi:hypothetical protein